MFYAVVAIFFCLMLLTLTFVFTKMWIEKNNHLFLLASVPTGFLFGFCVGETVALFLK